MKALGKASSWSLRTPVSTLAHCLAVVVFICALSVVTSAYTLVLRNGRRVEIPATFTLTQNTITYEAAPTINVTLLLTVVDIAATERANNELAGSFLRHSQQNQDASADIETRKAQVTVTNLDLEPARRARVQSELAYEKRRKELGLPTIEESRRRRAQEAAETATLIRERQLELDGTESYWRERAGALRARSPSLPAPVAATNSPNTNPIF